MSTSSSRFLTDTAVVPLGDGRYSATIDRGWWIVMGPNGGYIAGIVARAIEAEVADAQRRIRSLTLNYLRPPVEGPVEVQAVVQRRGRGVATVTAQLSQGGQLIVIAIASVTSIRDAPEFDDSSAPAVAMPEAIEGPQLGAGPGIEMSARYDMRPCVGSFDVFLPEQEPGSAVTGGWIRFSDSTPIDQVGLIAIADAWWPPVFHRFPGRQLAAPTVDLTVHVHRLPEDPLDWVLARFMSPVAADGFLIADGEIWDRHGNQLAVSRQLAVFA